MDSIQYRDGFDYQLDADYETKLSFGSHKIIKTYWVTFSPDGKLKVNKGYAWDGPSGPTIKTKNFMRGSLIHDVLYQLIRQGELPMFYRKAADEELRKCCLQDGMSKLRAWWVYKALEFAGRAAALPSATKRIHRAP